MRTLLIAAGAVGGSIWIGGLIVVVLVTRVVRSQLPAADQVEFFRSFGRRYLALAGGGLAAAYLCGGRLLTEGAWDARRSEIAAAAVALAAVTAGGAVQAGRLTALRRRAAATADPDLARRLRRGAGAALALRGLIAGLTLLLVLLTASLVPG